ncbi:unnamed protein product [Vitrella brassicaformis CCMP3155]|uniref:Uncharacterized protein n=1 Tax=Vitrella brassicaformis (strain CCMP3155) TaxID=1169540 RepID=A0A0G4F9U1_VITBC|nr:unnamed protein product [Vitrella brassicaformis CCMP3155]|eukprot:CEM09155.1 unnamed protein product [Vitrella brassicaformis CCMP3155]
MRLAMGKTNKSLRTWVPASRSFEQQQTSQAIRHEGRRRSSVPQSPPTQRKSALAPEANADNKQDSVTRKGRRFSIPSDEKISSPPGQRLSRQLSPKPPTATQPSVHSPSRRSANEGRNPPPTTPVPPSRPQASPVSLSTLMRVRSYAKYWRAKAKASAVSCRMQELEEREGRVRELERRARRRTAADADVERRHMEWSDEIMSSLAAAEREVEALRETNAHQGRRIESLRERETALEAEVEEGRQLLEAQTLEHRREMDAMRQSLELLGDRQHSPQGSSESLQDTDAQQELTAVMESHKRSQEALRRTCKSLEKERHELLDRIHELERQLDTERVEKDRLEGEQRDHLARIGYLQQDLDNMRQRVQELDEELGHRSRIQAANLTKRVSLADELFQSELHNAARRRVVRSHTTGAEGPFGGGQRSLSSVDESDDDSDPPSDRHGSQDSKRRQHYQRSNTDTYGNRESAPSGGIAAATEEQRESDAASPSDPLPTSRQIDLEALLARARAELEKAYAQPESPILHTPPPPKRAARPGGTDGISSNGPLVDALSLQAQRMLAPADPQMPDPATRHQSAAATAAVAVAIKAPPPRLVSRGCNAPKRRNTRTESLGSDPRRRRRSVSGAKVSAPGALPKASPPSEPGVPHWAAKGRKRRQGMGQEDADPSSPAERHAALVYQPQAAEAITWSPPPASPNGPVCPTSKPWFQRPLFDSPTRGMRRIVNGRLQDPFSPFPVPPMDGSHPARPNLAVCRRDTDEGYQTSRSARVCVVSHASPRPPPVRLVSLPPTPRIQTRPLPVHPFCPHAPLPSPFPPLASPRPNIARLNAVGFASPRPSLPVCEEGVVQTVGMGRPRVLLEESPAVSCQRIVCCSAT